MSNIVLARQGCGAATHAGDCTSSKHLEQGSINKGSSQRWSLLAREMKMDKIMMAFAQLEVAYRCGG